MMYQYKGITFEDVETTEGIWSGICQNCVDLRQVATSKLDEHGSGCCMVLNCKNEADYYIDFKLDELTEVESYKCQVCGKFVAENQGITTLEGNWVCDDDSCRTLTEDSDSHTVVK